MKMNKKFSKLFPSVLVLTLVATLLLAAGCKNKNNNTPDGACEMTLFDGDDFTDDFITIKGPGEFPDLNNLPNTDKKWSNEGDSFKAGENAIVTLFTEPNFKGDSTTYEAGAEEGSVDEPRSIKIQCANP